MSSKKTERPLPDTRSWIPRNAAETLTSVFAKECQGAEERLLQTLQREKGFAVDSFSSGVPFENAVRKEIRTLLPRRYSVTSGLVLDREGKTSGNCDIVIFNDSWFTPVKSNIEDTRLQYLPIEGVYAIGEVKQTLSAATLDEAMEKLVKSHRLARPRTCANRLTENRERDDCPHGLTNPLFSFVLAGGVGQDENFNSLVERFFDISRKLKRLELIRALCVLGEGAVWWAFHDPLQDNTIRTAHFVKDDLFHPIFPALSPAATRSPFLALMQILNQNLFNVVLGPEDLGFAYSRNNSIIKTPIDPSISLPVDDEWRELLDLPCNKNHPKSAE